VIDILKREQPYGHDVIIDRGEVRKRKKKSSKNFRKEFGHTPVSIEEKLPWEMPAADRWHWKTARFQ
jgi:hypothetical protein